MKILVPEAAEYLECSEARVLELLRLGALPGVKLGQSWVIPRQAFYEAVEALAVSRATLASADSGWGLGRASEQGESAAAENRRLRQFVDDLPMVASPSRAGRRLPRSVEPFSQV